MAKDSPFGRLLWLCVHLGLGLAWIALLVSQAGQGHGIGASGFQLFWMLLLAGWLPSWALAGWQVRRRRWRALLASDLLAAGVMVLLALTVYLPLALLPRGLLTELLLRLMTARRSLVALLVVLLEARVVIATAPG